MSRQIQGVIKRRAKSYPITRFNRTDGFYDDDTGLWVDNSDAETTVRIHLQPVKDQITDGPEGQRQRIEWRGWAVDEDGNEIANKDKITVGTGIYTIADLEWWPGVYREFNVIRSGEAENVSDT